MKYNTLVNIAEFKKYKYKKGQTISTKTYIKSGFLGLGLKRGTNMKVKSTGDSKKDAVKIAKAFHNREKKAGRM